VAAPGQAQTPRKSDRENETSAQAELRSTTYGPPNRLSPYQPGYLIRTFVELPLRKGPRRIRPIVSLVSTPNGPLNALIRAIVYGDHGTKWQQVALSPQFRRIKTWNGSAVQEEGVLALQLVSEQTRKLAEGNLSF
jgi:hypothetical protein